MTVSGLITVDVGFGMNDSDTKGCFGGLVLFPTLRRLGPSTEPLTDDRGDRSSYLNPRRNGGKSDLLWSIGLIKWIVPISISRTEIYDRVTFECRWGVPSIM